MVTIASQVLGDVMSLAIPIAIVFEVGNLIVCTFMRVAFGGRLWFGRD